MSTAHAIAQLRHLYSQMVGGFVIYPAEAARGLLGPAIAELERAAEAGPCCLSLYRAAGGQTSGGDCPRCGAGAPRGGKG